MESDQAKLQQWNNGVKDWGIHPGRQHLSPGILHIVDNLGIPYSDMELGQALIIHAEDAATRKPSFFVLEVVSVRAKIGRDDRMTATLRFKEGDFSFYRGELSTAKPVRVSEGTLMESGFSGTLIPQMDARMSYFGGIGLGRDHLFEYVDGRDKSIIVHNLIAIDAGPAPADWQQPDLTEYFKKIEATRVRQEQQQKDAIKSSEEGVEAFLKEKFAGHPLLEQIKDRLKDFSYSGKVVIASYLVYAKEDGVFDKAWGVFEKANKGHYYNQHPSIRGDIDILGQNREKLTEMMREAGIKWPRPDHKSVDQNGPELGEIPNIKKPEDGELLAKLKRKLEEYRSRFDNPKLVANARHKASVLEVLLEKGEVDTVSIKDRLSQEPWFNEDVYENAVWVINEYCSVGGRGRVSGGTGLR